MSVFNIVNIKSITNGCLRKRINKIELIDNFNNKMRIKHLKLLL
jgi:hypothetical protein